MSSTSQGSGGPRSTPEGEPPTQFANVTPPPAMLDHSFTLQAIMDLKGTVASYGTKIDRLIDDVGKHGEKLDIVRNQISFVRGALWVIGGLLVIAMAGITIYLRVLSH